MKKLIIVLMTLATTAIFTGPLAQAADDETCLAHVKLMRQVLSSHFQNLNNSLELTRVVNNGYRNTGYWITSNVGRVIANGAGRAILPSADRVDTDISKFRTQFSTDQLKISELLENIGDCLNE